MCSGEPCFTFSLFEYAISEQDAVSNFSAEQEQLLLNPFLRVIRAAPPSYARRKRSILPGLTSSPHASSQDGQGENGVKSSSKQQLWHFRVPSIQDQVYQYSGFSGGTTVFLDKRGYYSSKMPCAADQLTLSIHRGTYLFRGYYIRRVVTHLQKLDAVPPSANHTPHLALQLIPGITSIHVYSKSASFQSSFAVLRAEIKTVSNQALSSPGHRKPRTCNYHMTTTFLYLSMGSAPRRGQLASISSHEVVLNWYPISRKEG